MQKMLTLIAALFLGAQQLYASPLGLPEVPIPADNPQSKAKIKLGEKLFHDVRFSKTGTVSCATCHDAGKAFTDSPLRTSKGINELTGTRNAPTVVNAVYFTTQFWDGREASLESQSAQPFINPVEMGLESHQPIIDIVQSDRKYQTAFAKAFGIDSDAISMKHVKQAIASFERTIVAGNSNFDNYYFGNNKGAMKPAAVRGFQVFVGQGRCVSCHTIQQNHALFTDNRFHNIGVGFNKVAQDIRPLSKAYSTAKAQGENVDIAVLTNKNTSELGRFAIDDSWNSMGAFKTPTLRNIALTKPYMHDGSLETLEDVVDFYNNGGRVNEDDPVNDFLSSGIRPLNLTEQQKKDLVVFLRNLTSPSIVQSMRN